MSLHQTLDARTSQVITMTPRLQQAIKLLQLNQQELLSFLQEQVLDNPFLILENQQEDTLPTCERNDPTDDYFTEFYENDSAVYQEKSTLEAPSPFFNISQENSLRNHLLEQLHIKISDEYKLKLGEYLIDSINERGFLEESTLDLSERLNINPEMLEAFILHLQTFDPIGVFARSLTECLMLQLKDQNLLTKEFSLFLSYLTDLTTQPLKEIAKKCSITQEVAASYLHQLKKLTFNPAAAFNTDPAPSIIPDVFVKKTQDGWHVYLNQHACPSVTFDTRTYQALRHKSQTSTEKNYLSAQYNHSTWIRNALDQRYTTLLTVVERIVQYQEDFLEKGFSHFKSLSLRQIADQLDIHESTVSRITTGKYIATPRGIFDLKFFFTSAVKTFLINDAQEGASARTVQELLRTLVKNEDQLHPLSDDDLVEKMLSHGVVVARRTITKYRKILGIGSSFERKRADRLRQKLTGSF